MGKTLHLFDLDGCLFDDTHRAAYAEKARSVFKERLFTDTEAIDGAWDAYHELHIHDTTLNGAVVMDAAARGEQIAFLTARPERHRRTTYQQLLEVFGEIVHKTSIYMRGNSDRRPSEVFKVTMIVDAVVPIYPGRIIFYDNSEKNLASAKHVCGIETRLLDKHCSDEHLRKWGLLAQQSSPSIDAEMGALSKRTAEWHNKQFASGGRDLPATYIVGSGESALHNPRKISAGDVLTDMAATFDKRNEVYKDNYLAVPELIKILLPDGISTATLHSPTWHLLELIVVKLTRFARTGMTHTDSIHDVAVYAAMIEAHMTNEKGSGNGK